MKIDEEIIKVMIAISACVWVLTVVYGGMIVLQNVTLEAKLNALETVCKANAIREGAL